MILKVFMLLLCGMFLGGMCYIHNEYNDEEYSVANNKEETIRVLRECNGYYELNDEELFELAKKMEKHGGYFLKGVILLLAIIIGLLISILF